MMMMMIMIAGFVDSITTPIKSWLDTVVNSNDHHNTANMTTSVDSSRVECIVCLSEVVLGEKYAMLGRCKHGFHVECLDAWLKHHSSCPLCRTTVFGGDDTHNHSFYLKKSYEFLSFYSFLALETMASWLTSSFSKGLQYSLSESCKYL